MNGKVLAFLAVGIMALMAFAPVAMEDSDAAPSASTTVHPMPTYQPWVSKQAFKPIQSVYGNFTSDPAEGVTRYYQGEITYDQLKTEYGYITTPTSDYYYVNMGGWSNEFNVSRTRSVVVLDISVISGCYNSDPFDGLSSFENKQMTADAFKAAYEYTDSPGSTYYQLTHNGGNTISVGHYNGSWWDDYRYYSVQYEYNLRFYDDPYDALQRYADGEISMDDVKTQCRYIEEGSSYDWSKIYSVNLDYGEKIRMNVQAPQKQYRVSPSLNELRGDAYYTSDPYDLVVNYINGVVDLATLKSSCGYVAPGDLDPDTAYYAASVNGSDTGTSASLVRFITVIPEYIYLDVGTYTITITDTDCSDYINIEHTNPSTYYSSISIKDRKGADDIKVRASDAIWFSSRGGYGTLDTTWRELSITYVIDPAPSSGSKMTDFSKTVTVLSDQEWVRYTSVDSYTGKYWISSASQYLFIQGSEKENEFVKNVIDKGLVDGSAYGNTSVDATNQKLVVYELRETSASLQKYIGMNVTDTTGTNWVSVECDSEKLSMYGVDPYRFYANYDFTLAVQYDMAKTRAVVMMYTDRFGSTVYSVLESGRIYTFHMVSSNEYELYCIPLNNSDGTITPTEIGIYTENVGEADNMGTVFAVVAIVLCVIAFGTLFYAGRHPRWNDSTGLPGDTESFTESSAPAEVPEDAEVPSDESDTKEE